MPDISMCEHTKCKLSKTCYRHRDSGTVPGMGQSYFVITDNFPLSDKGRCKYYWKILRVKIRKENEEMKCKYTTCYYGMEQAALGNCPGDWNDPDCPNYINDIEYFNSVNNIICKSAGSTVFNINDILRKFRERDVDG